MSLSQLEHSSPNRRVDFTTTTKARRIFRNAWLVWRPRSSSRSKSRPRVVVFGKIIVKFRTIPEEFPSLVLQSGMSQALQTLLRQLRNRDMLRRRRA